MSSNNKLYRNFIILQEDERGYTNSADKTLSGYSKIEAKGEKCKISFYAQNLRSGSDNYSMMLICSKKDLKQIIDLGPISISESGKGEATKEFAVDNIGCLDVPFEKVSGAAIAKMNNGIPIYVMCGFLNGEQPSDNWKNYKVTKACDQKFTEKATEKVSEKTSEKIVKKEPKREAKKEEKVEEKRVPIKKVTSIKEETVEPKTVHEEYENAPKENLRGKFDDYEDTVEDRKEFNAENSKIRGSIGEYFETIAEGFEVHKNAFREIKHTKWYKIPVNDLHEMCNMSNYNRYTLAYYPMLNYYPYIRKYGHFMLGYKCDEEGNLRYIVYGVPGNKDRSEQPYDGKTGFVTWVQDGERDEVGCWLMFYDFKNSTVVVPMQ